MRAIYQILSETQRERVIDGQIWPILRDCNHAQPLLVLIWPQLGDFDSLEYAWWLQKESSRWLDAGLTIRAVGIGDRNSGQKFCNYTKFPADWLFVDPKAELHSLLSLYRGLSLKVPRFSANQNAWLNLLLMCAGIGSPGTLAEVFRSYRGDRKAPQLIAEEETIEAKPLAAFRGSLFNLAGGKGFQRPFELATLRLRNMSEVLGNWRTYVPDSAYLTQRGGSFLFDSQGNLIYEHRDRSILGFAENKSYPLAFLQENLKK
jgi:AhpC/TSA antioxidant enzyme